MIKTLKHSFRIEENKSENIYENLTDKNEYYFTNGKTGFNKMNKEIVYNEIIKQLEKNKTEQKEKYNSVDKKTFDNSKKNIKKSFKKHFDIDIKELENNNIDLLDYTNKNFNMTKYKNEKMGIGIKKRFVESVEKYVQMKNNFNNNNVQSTNGKTLLQEMVYKIPNKFNQDLTNKEIKKIIISNQKRNIGKILGFVIHNDESSRHLHLFFTDPDFQLLQKQVDYINKKFNKNFNYKNMSKEELIEMGELQQKLDREVLNDKNVKNVLSHELDKTLTNEERIERNSKMNRDNRMKKLKISEREFNNRNFIKKQIKNLENKLKLLLKLENIDTDFKKGILLYKKFKNSFRNIKNKYPYYKYQSNKNELSYMIDLILSNNEYDTEEKFDNLCLYFSNKFNIRIDIKKNMNYINKKERKIIIENLNFESLIKGVFELEGIKKNYNLNKISDSLKKDIEDIEENEIFKSYEEDYNLSM